MKILLVVNNVVFAENLYRVLTEYLYAVDIVSDAEAAWNQVKMITYDVILLDIMLPKLDGIHFCRRLRFHNYHQSIVMFADCGSSRERVQALDAGADDYIAKPINLLELLARIRALLRRNKNFASPVLRWGSLSLDPSSFDVLYESNPVHLTPKQFSILELFLRNGPRVLSRSVIIESIWSFERPPEEDTVKSHIKSLRNKLNTVGAPKDLIETVHSLGYRLKNINEKLQISIK